MLVEISGAGGGPQCHFTLCHTKTPTCEQGLTTSTPKEFLMS